MARGELAKDDVAKITYTPNFQPYFVRPRPVTDEDQSLKVKKGYVGDDFKALAVRTVKFAGNTFDGVYHDYRGDGDPTTPAWQFIPASPSRPMQNNHRVTISPWVPTGLR